MSEKEIDLGIEAKDVCPSMALLNRCIEKGIITASGAIALWSGAEGLCTPKS